MGERGYESDTYSEKVIVAIIHKVCSMWIMYLAVSIPISAASLARCYALQGDGVELHFSGLILGVCPANERRR